MTETVTRTEMIVPEPAEGLAGLLDIDLPPGGRLPPLWHWIYLLDRRKQHDLGPDGHPAHGIPAPPGPGRLRMFAGGRVTTHALLRFGEYATRTTRVLHTTEKLGKSGPLTFVTVRSEIEQDGRLAIADEQDIVYRQPGTALPPPALAIPGTTAVPSTTSVAPVPSTDSVPPGAAGLALHVDPVLLFRFSALTYNAHRIHYDAAYAAQEGYPGLVVHGPLQALMMGELFRRAGELFTGREFTYRLVAPMFGTQTFTVTSTEGISTLALSAQVRDAIGHVTATSGLLP
ncbi:hypothetical protein Aph01nite_34980 [Acrocarpospora phusangensis]|uniref:N-terminal of MaoC-like dehydratase domain-containing protein n=1 Tax=Acrocarpospora phusangensis TaxID=1070424 RepID=A0A919UPB2_9ACTN|nr:mesaconyl-C4 CoA hydratase [Acrocarpospora phusangensis]GIH25188.1 hypothetical protein Aph01nite_34980 [Acrocarpospora phusangensis]